MKDEPRRDSTFTLALVCGFIEANIMCLLQLKYGISCTIYHSYRTIVEETYAISFR